MAKSRKDDLNDILGEIQSGSTRKPAAKGVRKGKAPEQKIFLILAIVVFAVGIGYIAYDNLRTVPPVVEPPEIAPGVPADVNIVDGTSSNFIGGPGGGGGGATRPPDVLDLLPLPYEKFGPAANLTEALGPDYDVYLLLRAPLDIYTESQWRRDGLLRREGPVISPFIRKVTVGSRASIEDLVDWHIDLVAKVPLEKPQNENDAK